MRQSNFELLRIVSITLIMLMHLVVAAVFTDNTTNKILLLLINTIGNTGVTLFILISGYFGISFSLRKLCHTLFIVWFYSIISYLFEIFVMDKSFHMSDFFVTIFPIIKNKYWFMTSYIILFCLSPYINQLKQYFSKQRFQALLLVLILIFYILPTFFYVDYLNNYGKNIVNMVIAYLIGQYINVHSTPWLFNKYKYIILSFCLLFILSINTFVTFIKDYFFLWFAHDNSIFILLSSICIFLFFKELKMSSNFINKLAKHVFPLYLTQHLLTIVFRPWCEAHNNDYSFIIYITLSACLIWLVTIVVECVRNILFTPLINKVSELIIKITNQLIQPRLLDRNN